jgi:hypothetical protein
MISERTYIDVAAAMVRLYVFLDQYLDRCFNEAARKSYPDADLQHHLTTTRTELMEILAVNPVVRRNLSEECDRILTLGASCLQAGSADRALNEQVQAERATLRNKTRALSDLVAVYRALS